MRRTALTVLSAVTLTAAPLLSAQSRASAGSAAPLAPRQMPAGHYEFTSTSDNGEVTTGAVSWVGQQMRIDMDKNQRRSHSGGRQSVGVDAKKGDYMLVDFSSKMVRQVNPAEREISEMPLATFEQIIGKALGLVGGVVQMQVRDAGIIAKEVGPGGQVAGMETQQYRMIEEYNVRVGVFGMNAEEKHHRVVTEYWVPTQASVPRNPMFELLMRGASAMAQQDAAHQANISRARSALFTGFPVKAVVTVNVAGESAKRASVEITSLTSQTPDAALFVVPSGYKVKKNDLNFSM